jgi:hypothetical protein
MASFRIAVKEIAPVSPECTIAHRDLSLFK